MPLDGTKTFKPSNLHMYTAEVGTVKPKDLNTPGDSWTHAGHSSLDDILTFQTEGGETTTLGSIQNRSLRQSTTAAVRSMVINLLQWDTATLKLYYGANTVVDDGAISIPETPSPSEKAVLIVVEDGESRFAAYAARASLIGEGDVSITDTESLAQLPIRITPLSHENKHPLTLVAF